MTQAVIVALALAYSIAYQSGIGMSSCISYEAAIYRFFESCVPYLNLTTLTYYK